MRIFVITVLVIVAAVVVVTTIIIIIVVILALVIVVLVVAVLAFVARGRIVLRMPRLAAIFNKNSLKTMKFVFHSIYKQCKNVPYTISIACCLVGLLRAATPGRSASIQVAAS